MYIVSYIFPNYANENLHLEMLKISAN